MTPHATRPRAVIIHGYAASPEDHWFGWLAQQLRATGTKTSIPTLPDPRSPDWDRWGESVGEALDPIDQNTTVIAHSLGCLTVLRHLAARAEPWTLGTLILVSGFLEPLPALPELDTFIGDSCDVTGLPARIGRIALFRSDDDPLVPTGHTDRLARLLGARAHIVDRAGHFLASDGVTRVPEVLSAARHPAADTVAQAGSPWSRAWTTSTPCAQCARSSRPRRTRLSSNRQPGDSACPSATTCPRRRR